MPIIYIVLPPDLTYQAMKILIHYMYRGESRVSNDILKEVLHAGDVLKVRGLYRGDTGGKENKSNVNIEKPHTRILRPSTSHHTTPLNTSSNIQNTMQMHSEMEPQKVVSVINAPTHTNAISPRTNKNFDPITYAGHKVYKVAHTAEPTVLAAGPALLKHGRPSVDSIAQTNPQKRPSIDNTGPVKTSASHLVNFLTTIKEEPVEWNEEFSMSDKIKCDRRQMYIKEEGVTLPHTTFQKLSCEICAEDFIQPADWVRHVERHTDHTATVPRKRRRSGVEIDDENTASLRCDLCATYFITPAEWVKHVQSRHTEMELALENEKL